jgi:hypothetical protein
MNPKRLVLAIVAVFIATFATDFLIHGVWMTNDYAATMSLWRPEADMKRYFPFLLLGQFLFAAAFVVIWSKGFPAVSTLGGTCLYAVTMALFSQAETLVLYAVQPLPAHIAVKWFLAGLVQGVVLGVVVFFVGKPSPPAPARVV